MFEFFNQLYKSTDFMPHGNCLLWNPTLLWLHAGSDVITGIAYYLIAVLLGYFIFKRRDIPYCWIFVLFTAFIFSCGTTHFMAAWTIYYPSYWAEGIIKAINAGISLGTAIVLFPMMEKLLTLPSLKKANDEIAELNQQLERQVSELTSENIKRQKAENQLQESHSLLKAVIEGTTDAIFMKDLQGRYILANNATLQALGKSAEELIGKDADALFPADFAKNIREIETSVIVSGKTRLTEDRLETAAGETVWLTNTNPYRDKDGKVIGIIGVTRNITGIKKAEAEKRNLQSRLQQAQKMEAIGTLAGGIAHDFNNILAVILGYADIAKEDAPQNSTLRGDLEKIIGAGNRARDLVQQILTFSRQTKIARVPLQLQSLIKEALKMLRSSIPTTVEIQDDIDSRCGVVLVDPTQVHQILMNLCTNAYHAMEQSGGILKIALRNVVIDNGDRKLALKIQPGEYVELLVSDTGVGIDPVTMDKIFDPYFTTKETGKGTGLGLAIIHGIIHDYGGTITVESVLGQGTSFHVYFPVIDKEALPSVEEAEAIPLGRERILFVDDEEILAEMGKDMLERLGYTVTVRSSSLDALASFQNNPDAFDVVITDQTMPGMTGSDLARRMLRIRSDIPIILCTGYSNLVDEATAKSFGVKEFAMKPLTRGTIAKLIRKVLTP